MTRLKISIDMDGIVANTLPYWLQKIANKTGVIAQVSDITQWDLNKCPPLDKIDPKILFGMLQDRDFIRNVPPMWGAKEAVKLLAENHEVKLVTARTGPVSMPETLDWVQMHLPFINVEKQLVFLYDKDDMPADVLIDDKPKTLLKFKERYPSSHVLGIRYPYNKDLPANIKLFGDEGFQSQTLTWGQIVGYIQRAQDGAAEKLVEEQERRKAMDAYLQATRRPHFDFGLVQTNQTE